jgi:hypothetical protein
MPTEAMVVTDDPGLAWQAQRDVPPGLTDPSNARIAAGYLTADDLIAALDRPEVCAYLEWSSRFQVFADDVNRAVAGWTVELSDGWGGRLRVRPDCAVSATAEGT